MVMPINELAPTGRLRTIVQTMTFDATATSSPDVFTIANGAIYVEMFIGWISEVIVDIGGTDFYYEFTPATLAAGIEDLCTTLVCDNDPLDTIYTVTGDITQPMDVAENGLCLLPSFINNYWILGPGVVNLNIVAGTSITTGVLVTSMVYYPINNLVTVVAA